MPSPAASPLQRWLIDYCGRSAVITGGVVLQADAAGENLRRLAEWPSAGAHNQPLVGAATAAFKRGQTVVIVPPVAQPDAEFARIAAVPLELDGEKMGAIALGLRSTEDNVVQGFLGDLQRSGAEVAALLAAPAAVESVEAAKLLQLQSALLGRAKLNEAGLEFVNELAATLGFDRVSLGLVECGRSRVVALSHNAEFKSGQDLMRSLNAAMDEAADQGCTLVQPPRPGDKPRILLAHADLSARTGTAVCSVPLVCEGRAIGALVFERTGVTPPGRAEIALCEHLAMVVAPVVAIKHRAEQPLRTRAAKAIGRAWERVRHGDELWPKVAVFGGLAAFLILTLVPMPYRVGAPARIEGAEQRVLAAPMDGFLRQAHVRPGDAVKAGDILAEMVDQDLQLEERKWQAELSQHENAFIAAMARADRTQFSISQAKASEARAQLELVRSQLKRMQIAAPIDGIVIKGDLTQSLGAPLQRGDPLLTLAPREHFRLIIEVDERDIGRVQAGAPGQLALSALPGEALSIKVERIVPVAINHDGRNVFEVEASLDGGSKALRPGLQGVAKIRAGSQPLAWTLTHRLLDWLRLTVWSWGG